VRPDFVLGDRFGTSCNGELTRLAANQLKALGHAVTLNKPYAGGYITEHYGRPHKSQHVLQIEINRALYMDETSFEKSGGFERLRDDLEAMVAALITGIPSLAVPRAAAE
jgi:N-formylglutamate amidohydrolase